MKSCSRRGAIRAPIDWVCFWAVTWRWRLYDWYKGCRWIWCGEPSLPDLGKVWRLRYYLLSSAPRWLYRLTRRWL